MKSVLRVFLATAALACAGAAPSLAQSNESAAPPKPPAWSLTCSSSDAAAKALACQMSQQLVRQSTGELVMLISVVKPAGSSDLTLELLLPHGLNIPAGVVYQIDTGATSTAPIVSSGQNGAIASLPLTNGLSKTLKAGSQLMITLQTSSGGELKLPVSLTGFTPALDRLVGIQ